jgi:hypothetical protein
MAEEVEEAQASTLMRLHRQLGFSNLGLANMDVQFGTRRRRCEQPLPTVETNVRPAAPPTPAAEAVAQPTPPVAATASARKSRSAFKPTWQQCVCGRCNRDVSKAGGLSLPAAGSMERQWG